MGVYVQTCRHKVQELFFLSEVDIYPSSFYHGNKYMTLPLPFNISFTRENQNHNHVQTAGACAAGACAACAGAAGACATGAAAD